MLILRPGIDVHGEVRVSEDLTIESRVRGSVWADGATLTIAASATVVGDVIARDITVFGRVDGSLVATEVVDLRDGASATGRILSERLILNDGATFNGRVEPQHLQSAIKVARHRRSTAALTSPPGRPVVAGV